MKHGADVTAFEVALAERCGAKWAIGMVNGTATIQVALMALGVKPGSDVSTSPLTMAATTIAILNAGARPRYVDVDPHTWLMGDWSGVGVGVSLFGLHHPLVSWHVDDAAQTFRQHSPSAEFTSLSFQRSKILQTGEGGALLTNDDELAERARAIASLGYRLPPGQSRIDSATLKSPDFLRHHYPASLNARMNDVTAKLALKRLRYVDGHLAHRAEAAEMYRAVVAGVEWITPQYTPDGWRHDAWSFAVACDTPARAKWLQAEMAREGAEMPYGAWALTYREPAFAHLAHESWFDGMIRVPAPSCPVAEDLQPRILAFQTNDHLSADKNARALARIVDRAPAAL